MTRLGQMLMDEGMELKETDSIKKLMKNMNWTIDQAMNALEVPEDKREKYRKTITPDNWRYFLSYLYCKIVSYWYC